MGPVHSAAEVGRYRLSFRRPAPRFHLADRHHRRLLQRLGTVPGYAAALLDPGGELTRRIDPQLGMDQLGVGLAVEQRLRSFAGFIQSGHQTERSVGADGVELEKAAPPARSQARL